VLRSRRWVAATLAVLLGVWTASASAHRPDGRVVGVISDESNGVLPGVTVVATGPDGKVLATVVTDAAGRFRVGPLAAGRVKLTFQLEGFAEAALTVTVAADADTVVSQHLVVAPRSENVLVVGKVPEPPPPPPPPIPRPVSRPTPVTTPVVEHDRDSVCGPSKPGVTPESFGIITSRRSAGNLLYAEGDELVVDAGTRAGLKVGDNFAVRRTFRIEWDPHTEAGEHTAGVVQIVAAEEYSSVAAVIYTCDEIMPGDRLALFKPEPIRPPEPAGTPDYVYAARILFPDLGQLVGKPGRLMVIDHGTADGIRIAQRLTLFRRRPGGQPPLVVGQAVVVAVRRDSATIRVERATDAVIFGDWAAPHR
jgi:hypothetical protein